MFRAAIVAAVAISVAVLLPGVRELLAVDRCLDSGGAYDYARHLCRHDIPSLASERVRLFRRPDAGSALVAGAVAIALIRMFMTLDRRRTSRGRLGVRERQ